MSLNNYMSRWQTRAYIGASTQNHSAMLASLLIMLTGGVDATEASISNWIKAGAAALGRGRKLITAQAVKSQDYAGIATKASECIERIREAREK
jgi:2-dehydro-3-deoxyphosphogluconate aldolase/(4S)-4-hydroxy-2-oxoglutarate aldolase